MHVRCHRSLMLAGLCAFTCLPLLAGCGTTKVYVPPDRDIRLLEEDEPASVVVERRLWFWLWGNATINPDTPIPEIEEHDLKEVRVTSKQTLIDTVLNMLGGVASIVCRTMVVEGNP